jgi:hypothetical protein
VTPDQYRNHPSGALRRAFFRGGYAAQAGQALADNPYRAIGATKKARRGSWSESFTAAWAAGWHVQMELTAIRQSELAATSETRSGKE